MPGISVGWLGARSGGEIGAAPKGVGEDDAVTFVVWVAVVAIASSVLPDPRAGD